MKTVAVFLVVLTLGFRLCDAIKCHECDTAEACATDPGPEVDCGSDSKYCRIQMKQDDGSVVLRRCTKSAFPKAKCLPVPLAAMENCFCEGELCNKEPPCSSIQTSPCNKGGAGGVTTPATGSTTPDAGGATTVDATAATTAAPSA